MRIIGVTSPVGPPVVKFTVAHGQHPVLTLFELGCVPVRPMAATRVDGEILFTYLVRPVSGRDHRPSFRRSMHEEPDATEVPVINQRVGAYAMVVSERGLLGTVNSSLTSAPGTWTLPGGGIDGDESPAEAVIREVYEESGQQISIERVMALESDHWIGRSTTGVLEDFHALRIIYLATCKTPSEPVVLDLGGSTAKAGWVPLKSWNRLRWTFSSRTMLSRFGSRLVPGQSLK